VGATGSTWGARVPGKPDVTIGNVSALTFEQAAAIVRESSDAVDDTPESLRTIGEAVDSYVMLAAKTKGKASMGNIRAHQKMIAPMYGLTISGCNLPRLNRWKADLITDDRGPVGANKIIGTLKAALNADRIDGPWIKLRKYKEPKKTVADRAVVFTPDQIKLVLAKAAETDPDLHVLLMALWLTGARPGEIVSATRDAYQGSALTLTGKTGTRNITLTPKVAAFFADRAEACQTHLIEFDGRPLGSESHRYRWAALMASVGDQVLPVLACMSCVTASSLQRYTPTCRSSRWPDIPAPVSK
jgi:hypothetical protein